MSQDKLNTLSKWIKKHKGFVHPNIELNIQNNKHHYLKLTNKMSAKGVQLFSIPRKLCLDYGTYKAFETNIELTDIEKEIMNHKFFKLFLNVIAHKLKGKKSFYYNLISSLPQMDELVQTNPIFYYTEKKDIWKKYLPTIITKLDSLNQYYINLYGLIKKLNIFDKLINLKYFPKYKTKDEVLKTIVLWSFLIVNSYAIDNSLIMPLYNFLQFNHETDNKITIASKYVTFSYENIKQQSLVINNGILDNETLFVLHGYINDNKKTFLEIKLSDNYNLDDEGVKEIVEKIFEKTYNRKIQKYYITKDTPSINLVQYLRILSLTKRDIPLINTEEEFYTRFISMDNESGVYQRLLKIVNIKYSQIKKYDETPKKDDTDDIKVLKKILKDQKEILKSMYYEIHKKWISIMDTNLGEKNMKKLFELK